MVSRLTMLVPSRESMVDVVNCRELLVSPENIWLLRFVMLMLFALSFRGLPGSSRDDTSDRLVRKTGMMGLSVGTVFAAWCCSACCSSCCTGDGHSTEKRCF